MHANKLGDDRIPGHVLGPFGLDTPQDAHRPEPSVGICSGSYDDRICHFPSPLSGGLER